MEAVIKYMESNETRILRGIIDNEAGDFLTIKRRDGIFKINKKFIINIEYPKGD